MYFQGGAHRFHRKRKVDGSVVTSSYLYIVLVFFFNSTYRNGNNGEKNIRWSGSILGGNMFGFEMHI